MENAPNTRFRHQKLVFAALAAMLFVASILAFVSRSKSTDMPKAIELISSKMLLTRQKAIASQTRHRIQYDYLQNEFRIYREIEPGHYELDPPDNCYALPPGVAMSPTSYPVSGSIEIGPDGAVRPDDAPVVLKLSDQTRTKRSIRVTKAGMVQELPNW